MVVTLLATVRYTDRRSAVGADRVGDRWVKTEILTMQQCHAHS